MPSKIGTSGYINVSTSVQGHSSKKIVAAAPIIFGGPEQVAGRIVFRHEECGDPGCGIGLSGCDEVASRINRRGLYVNKMIRDSIAADPEFTAVRGVLEGDMLAADAARDVCVAGCIDGQRG